MMGGGVEYGEDVKGEKRMEDIRCPAGVADDVGIPFLDPELREHASRSAVSDHVPAAAAFAKTSILHSLDACVHARHWRRVSKRKQNDRVEGRRSRQRHAPIVSFFAGRMGSEPLSPKSATYRSLAFTNSADISVRVSCSRSLCARPLLEVESLAILADTENWPWNAEAWRSVCGGNKAGSGGRMASHCTILCRGWVRNCLAVGGWKEHRGSREIVRHRGTFVLC